MTDLPDELVDTTPWADGPLINNATGDFFYFAMSPSRARGGGAVRGRDGAGAWALCFDPLGLRLLDPAPRKSWRTWRR
jgi:hypothetical protein